MSPKYTLTKANLWPIIKVLLWSAASAIVASLIVIVQNAEVPQEYAVLMPIVNTILYTLKEYISEQ